MATTEAMIAFDAGALGPWSGVVAALLLVGAILAYARAWWRVLEDRPDPLIAWRSAVQRRR